MDTAVAGALEADAMPSAAADPWQVAMARYVAEGNPACLEALIAGHQRMVQAVCWQVLGDRALAEDAAQETFVQLLRHAEDVQRSVTGWLHRTAVTTALQMRRHETALKRRERAVMAETAHAVQAGDAAMVEVHALLAGCPPDDREVLVRHYVVGESQQHMAQALGISQSAVSRRLEAALERIRQRHGEEERRRCVILLPLLGAMTPGESVGRCHLLRRRVSGMGAAVTVTVGLAVGGGLWAYPRSPVVVPTPEPAPEPTPAATVMAPPTAAVAPRLGREESLVATLRWEHIVIGVEAGQATILYRMPLPAPWFEDPLSLWQLRPGSDPYLRAVLVSEVPPRPLRLGLSLRHQSSARIGFCEPVQRNPALMPPGRWQVAREPFVAHAAAAPGPGAWHELTAEVRFLTDQEGQPMTEIRRWCDGLEWASTRHPGHPVQLVLVQIHDGTAQVRDPIATRGDAHVPF